ncbi:N-formylglutamate amidohydrolase [Paenalkalicoccus suaedae]|uniref:N-formylglutamate amidohydrolase n=1 Tax=Paenalkalicoccus suaedae TaxID=2592382 RepID=A0A859FDX2_9BACI|nr:N-formylglutamate amidohydrolase [Paenalkalicoccus suaedae]QKS70426.1 N-formylglutamate amidohydrolase [Paenalkalicoccus suaedae]
MDKLPIFVSVPHGGTKVPEGLRNKLLLSELEIVHDGDTWTGELFDFKELAHVFVSQSVARIVVDMNRAPGDLPPHNVDGVVKTVAVTGENVWKPSLSEEEIRDLVETIHAPYHEAMREGLLQPISFGVDCHTMLAESPVIGGGEAITRPLFCISNRGGEDGIEEDEPVTASPAFMHRMRELIEEAFADYGIDGVELCVINAPFKGGYVTQLHGAQTDKPFVQLEINRRLYMSEESGVAPTKEERAQMSELREKLGRVFAQLAFELSDSTLR